MDSLDKQIPLEAIYLKYKNSNFDFKRYLDYRFKDNQFVIKNDGDFILKIIQDYSHEFSDEEISKWFSKLNMTAYDFHFFLENEKLSLTEKQRLSHLLLCNASVNLSDLYFLLEKYLVLMNGKYIEENWNVLWNYFLIQLPKQGWPNRSYGEPTNSNKPYDNLIKSLVGCFKILPVELQEKTIFNYVKIENDNPFKHSPNFYKLSLQLRLLQEHDVSSTKAINFILHCLQFKSLWEDCFECVYYFNKRHAFTKSEIQRLRITFEGTNAYKSLNPNAKQIIDEEISLILLFENSTTFPVVLNEESVPQLLLVSRGVISGPVFVKKAVNDQLDNMGVKEKIDLIVGGKDKFYETYYEVDYYGFVEKTISSLDKEQYNNLVSSVIDKKDWEIMTLIFLNKEKIKLIDDDVIARIIETCDYDQVYQLIIGFNPTVLVGCETRFMKILKQGYKEISFDTDLAVFVNSPLYDIARFIVKDHFEIVKRDKLLFESPLISLARLSVKPWDKEIEQCFNYLIDKEGKCNVLACFCYLQNLNLRNMKYYQYFLKERSKLKRLANYSDEWVGLFLQNLLIIDLNKNKNMKLGFILPYLDENDIEIVLKFILDNNKESARDYFLSNYTGPRDEFDFSQSLLDELMKIDLSNDTYLNKNRNKLVFECIKKTKEPNRKQCIEYLLRDDFENIELCDRFHLISKLSQGLTYWSITKDEKRRLIRKFEKTFQKETKLVNEIPKVVDKFNNAYVI